MSHLSMLLQTTRPHAYAAAPTRSVARREEARGRAGEARAWCLLASLSAFWGARTLAARHLRRALHHAPADPEISLRLGELLLGQERWPEAALVLSEAARRAPVCAETWGNLALALHRAGRWSAAAAALEALATQTPHPAEVLLLRATLLRRLGHSAQALHAFRAAAGATSAPAGTRFFLGEAMLGAEAWQALCQALPQATALTRTGAPDVTVGPRRRHVETRPSPTVHPQRSAWTTRMSRLPRRAAAACASAAARLRAQTSRAARHALGHALEACGRALCTRGATPLAIRCLREGVALRA